MKKILDFLNTTEKFFLTPISLWEWVGIFSGAVAVRLILDNLIAKTGDGQLLSIMNFHNWLFFLATLLLVWLIISLALGQRPAKLARFMAWGSLIFILPPLFDLWKTQGSVYWSAYLMGNLPELGRYFLTIFGHLPAGITYFGTKISFILGIFCVFSFAWHLTKKFYRAVLAAVGLYIGLFFMASFPSWLVFITKLCTGEKPVFMTPSFEIAQRVGTPMAIFGLNKPSMLEALAYQLNLVYFPLILLLLAIIWFSSAREKLWAVVKNARIPQIIYHTGLFISGLLLGFWYYPERFSLNLASFWAFFSLIFAIWAAWTASVFFNDLADESIDVKTNPQRPIPQRVFSREEYRQYGWAFFALSLLGGWLVAEKMAFLLLGYQIFAWWYSGETLRLKKVPLLATFLSALATSLVFLMGFMLVSGADNIKLLPARVVGLLLLAFTFSIPVKDFKDIAGDKKNGVQTLPVALGENMGKLVVGSGIFLAFILSVFLTHELRLFWPAVILGSASFFTLYGSSANGFIRYRALPFWILGWVFVYGWFFLFLAFF